MKRKSVVLIIIFLAVFFNPILSVSAVSRTYDWNTYGNTHYSVSVNVENPQFDSPFDVTVRLTLLSKDSSLEHTETRWMQVILDSADKPLRIESEVQSETQILDAVGDSWHRTFTFQVPSSQYGLGRGQGIEVSVIYNIGIDEIDIPRHLTWSHGDISKIDPLKISLIIPLLNTTELVVILVVAVIVALVIARFVYLEMRHRRLEREQKQRIEVKEKRKEAMLVDNFECPYCQTLYDKKLEKCPHCGAKKKMDS